MVDATESWDEPLHPERRTAGPAVRVVLAEAAHAPGPLHYLLEGEGFQVLGSASDEDELTRLLSQSAQPEVIVVDAAVPVTTALVAREYAPGSELIVIWPEDVVPPPSADQVLPELVFQDLGPAVQRAAERNRARHPVIDEPAEPELEVVLDADRVELSAVAARRTAARVLVGTVALIASIIVTMGVSFALEGWRASHIAAPARAPLVTSSSTTGLDRSSTTGSTTQVTAHPTRSTRGGCTTGAQQTPNAHATGHAKPRAAGCPSKTGGGGGQRRGWNEPGAGGSDGSSNGQGSDGQGSNGQGPGDHGSGQGSNDQGSNDQGTSQGANDQGSSDQGSDDQGGVQGSHSAGGQADQPPGQPVPPGGDQNADPQA